jgi:hypothetical protein
MWVHNYPGTIIYSDFEHKIKQFQNKNLMVIF